MSKYANAGELRTPVTVMQLVDGSDEDGFPTQSWVDPFGGPVMCKWVNAHGSEVYEAAAQQLKEPATITMRYSALVTPKCRIWREQDPHPYEIISIDDVRERHEFLEIKVKRVVST